MIPDPLPLSPDDPLHEQQGTSQGLRHAHDSCHESPRADTLPLELVFQILTEAAKQSQATAFSLCLVSTWCRRLCTPHLYQTISLDWKNAGLFAEIPGRIGGSKALSPLKYVAHIVCTAMTPVPNWRVSHRRPSAVTLRQQALTTLLLCENIHTLSLCSEMVRELMLVARPRNGKLFHPKHSKVRSLEVLGPSHCLTESFFDIPYAKSVFLPNVVECHLVDGGSSVDIPVLRQRLPQLQRLEWTMSTSSGPDMELLSHICAECDGLECLRLVLTGTYTNGTCSLFEKDIQRKHPYVTIVWLRV